MTRMVPDLDKNRRLHLARLLLRSRAALILNYDWSGIHGKARLVALGQLILNER
jgi:hypothetical protein